MADLDDGARRVFSAIQSCVPEPPHPECMRYAMLACGIMVGKLVEGGHIAPEDAVDACRALHDADSWEEIVSWVWGDRYPSMN